MTSTAVLQVLRDPVYMEDHAGVLEEEVNAGLVPLPTLPKYKQVRMGPVGTCRGVRGSGLDRQLLRCIVHVQHESLTPGL